MADDDVHDFDTALLRRVYGEYLEMPGLQLTLPQAARLWNLTPDLSGQVLTRLVDASMLRRVGERYVLARSGRCA